MHVQRQPVLGCVAPELAQRVGGACAHGVGCDTDADAVGAQRLQLAQVVGDRLLPETTTAAAEVAGVEAYELDAGFGRCRSGGTRLLEPEVVELADRREPVGA